MESQYTKDLVSFSLANEHKEREIITLYKYIKMLTLERAEIFERQY